MQAARYWEHVGEEQVRCLLCPHFCVLGEEQTGLCHVRTVRNGSLRAAGYGLISSAQLDPIEKKPLYHYYPGEAVFSVGSWGCNFACVCCQNWTISQQVIEGHRTYSPAEIVAQAKSADGIGIAYTYNEPLVSFEFVYDCALLAREAGLKNVLVTNGYIESSPASELLPLIDAINVDVKSMDDRFYHEKCRGHLAPVLKLAVDAAACGCHVEITNLVIPDQNDDDALIIKLADWIANSLGEMTPLHLSGYRPHYKSTSPATTEAHLSRAYNIAREKLSYVYLGNIATDEGQLTRCPHCHATQIERFGYTTQVVGIEGGRCVSCGHPADIVIRP
jgi:pyruvate formate lyase activating enzyme